jgi:hypothetical protein
MVGAKRTKIFRISRQSNMVPKIISFYIFFFIVKSECQQCHNLYRKVQVNEVYISITAIFCYFLLLKAEKRQAKKCSGINDNAEKIGDSAWSKSTETGELICIP